jgi:hypothetical protein
MKAACSGAAVRTSRIGEIFGVEASAQAVHVDHLSLPPNIFFYQYRQMGILITDSDLTWTSRTARTKSKKRKSGANPLAIFILDHPGILFTAVANHCR